MQLQPHLPKGRSAAWATIGVAAASFCSGFAGTNYLLGHRLWHARPDTFAHIPEQVATQAVRSGQAGLEQMNWQTLELQARTFMPTEQSEPEEKGIDPEAIAISSAVISAAVVEEPIALRSPSSSDIDVASEFQQAPPTSLEVSPQDFAVVPYIGRAASALN